MKKELDRYRLDIDVEATEEEFQRYAIKWLRPHVGFDGILWANGKRLETGIIEMEDFLLEGRPHKLIEDYTQIAGIDPVWQRFTMSPQLPQNIDVHSFYSTRKNAVLLEHLERYRIRHLFLMGVQEFIPVLLNWIVLYREDQQRPFDATMDTLAASAISTVLHGIQFRRAAETILRMSPRACAQEKNACIYLTDRQQQVLAGLKRGLSNKAIARELAISENTLKTHLSTLYRTLNVVSRTQAIMQTGTVSAHRWT